MRRGEIQIVRLGTTYLQTETLDSEDYNIIRKIPHPKYNAGEQYNDIALLQLDRPVKFSESIQPICLYSSKNIAQETLIATGWGKNESAGDVSPELQKVDLEYFPNNNCQQIYSIISQQDLPRGIDGKTHICAGSRTQPKDTCQVNKQKLKICSY
ncbi:hypothetical protein NQ314_004199 [Rhamnusium bicolor]|uniref:Peptidase S1 domain-containing protein n=1 Tax=Rhamnusium bicolor TaxID=1586634 RepID=A0AAV8ZLU1_9CUCU|nr:hypothetical protein NQ314_004199 [Rhamnusium bicolor]